MNGHNETLNNLFKELMEKPIPANVEQLRDLINKYEERAK